MIFAYTVYAIPMTIGTRKNRNQTFFSTLDDQVMADNPVRLINAFVQAGFSPQIVQIKTTRFVKPRCTKDFISHEYRSASF